jgi:hypothetical protein
VFKGLREIETTFVIAGSANRYRIRNEPVRPVPPMSVAIIDEDLEEFWDCSVVGTIAGVLASAP